MSQAEGRHAPTPVLAFSLDEGSADLFIDGEKRDHWLPLMFANKDLKKCHLTEPEDARDMAIVETRRDIKPVSSEEAAGRALDEFSQNDFRHQLVNSDAAKKGLTGGVYVQVNDNVVDHWTIYLAGPARKRKTTVPKQWTELGLNWSENTFINFELDPKNIRFNPNSSVSSWLSFDEMQLTFPREISTDQKARLLFRYSIKPSSKIDALKLYVEMLMLPRGISLENLPETKKIMMNSSATLTMPFYGQNQPIFWDGENASAGITFMPTFGLFNSSFQLTDSSVRRIIYDVMVQMEAGESTNKVQDLHKFLENPKSKLTFKDKILKIAEVPEISVVHPPPEDKQQSSGKPNKIKRCKIRALAGSKYDRKNKFSTLCKVKLKAALPPETTWEDVDTVLKVMSASIANTTACNYKSVKNKFRKVLPERNCLQEPKFGDEVLLLGRLLKSPGLKKKTVKQYMKCYKTLVLMEGATPAPESPHYKQLLKGLTNIAHNPLAFVASSQRKAYCLSSLRIMGHAIKATDWSEFKKQVVFTTMLLAFWGRLRLSEILCSSALTFKPLNAFLKNDLRFIKIDDCEGSEGLQLWIRHAKVPDPNGALVEIPPAQDMPDLCPVKAVKKYLRMREKLLTNGEYPLLLNDTGFIFTKRKFGECIQQAIDKLDPKHREVFKDLKGHSLRSGVPTALQKLGTEVDPQVMKYLGRWRGCSVNLYLKDKAAAAKARMSIASAMNKIVK